MDHRVLLLSPQPKEELVNLSQKFCKILNNDVDLHLINEIHHVQDFYANKGDATVLVVDISFSGFSTSDIKSFHKLFGGIRKLDQHACILMMTDEMPHSRDLMNWMDHGATGVINSSFDPEKLSDSLKDMLQSRVSLGRQLPRAPAIHSIRLNISSLEQAVVSETLNIGHGGFFIASIIKDAKIDEIIEFEFIQNAQELASVIDNKTRDPLVEKMDANDIGVNGDSLKGVKGIGKIAWIRASGDDADSVGMGVEFVELDEESKNWIHEYVRSRRIHAFIPKN